MEVNWTTFLLEIINFLVLVWILKRFLYRPVLGIINQRREGIEKAMAEAQALDHQAHVLQTQYENRLAAWESEKQQARETLGREIETERQQRLQQLESRLQQERDKAIEADAHRQAETQRKLEATALTQAAGFASRLLTALRGPELEAGLLSLLAKELEQMDSQQLAQLRQSLAQDDGETIMICSAYPLNEAQQEALQQSLETLLGRRLAVEYQQQDSLLAGVRITIGAWVLGASLEDELKGFAELAHDE